MKHRYPMGVTYTDRHGRCNTIVDRLTTTNNKGVVVSIRYASETTVAGSIVTDYNVTDTEITRALMREQKNVGSFEELKLNIKK